MSLLSVDSKFFLVAGWLSGWMNIIQVHLGKLKYHSQHEYHQHSHWVMLLLCPIMSVCIIHQAVIYSLSLGMWWRLLLLQLPKRLHHLVQYFFFIIHYYRVLLRGLTTFVNLYINLFMQLLETFVASFLFIRFRYFYVNC